MRQGVIGSEVRGQLCVCPVCGELLSSSWWLTREYAACVAGSNRFSVGTTHSSNKKISQLRYFGRKFTLNQYRRAWWTPHTKDNRGLGRSSASILRLSCCGIKFLLSCAPFWLYGTQMYLRKVVCKLILFLCCILKLVVYLIVEHQGPSDVSPLYSQ